MRSITLLLIFVITVATAFGGLVPAGQDSGPDPVTSLVAGGGNSANDHPWD